jgi:hypothetical protein
MLNEGAPSSEVHAMPQKNCGDKREQVMRILDCQ